MTTADKIKELVGKLLLANARSANLSYEATPGGGWPFEIEAAEKNLVAAIDALAKDAARYRWLRDQPPHHNEPDLPEVIKSINIDLWKGSLGKVLTGVDADAAIDAEMEKAND